MLNLDTLEGMTYPEVGSFLAKKRKGRFRSQSELAEHMITSGSEFSTSTLLTYISGLENSGCSVCTHSKDFFEGYCSSIGLSDKVRSKIKEIYPRLFSRYLSK